MLYSRFLQICAPFHIERGQNKEDDKCHQLWNAKNPNKAAALTFIPGKEMSFDEGGIPSESDCNHIGQYLIVNLTSIKLTFHPCKCIWWTL